MIITNLTSLLSKTLIQSLGRINNLQALHVDSFEGRASTSWGETNVSNLFVPLQWKHVVQPGEVNTTVKKIQKCMKYEENIQ